MARNKVTAIKTQAKQLLKEYEHYHDPQRRLARGKKNGVYIWKMKLWPRARQIRYFIRKRKRDGE